MVSHRAIVTLVFFLISAGFVIKPVTKSVSLPYLGRRRLTLNLVSAPILAILILWASQCLGATEIRRGFSGIDGVKPYNILILFGSLAYMAITLDISGVLQAAAFWVSNRGGSKTRKLFFYFYLMLILLSVVVGNDPVILSGTAFLFYYTTAAGLEPTPWIMSEFAAANTASMVLFVGNPTNVVICEGFNVNNAAFTAYTILPFLACAVGGYLALSVQFRDEKHLPRRVPLTMKLNVREALRDPTAAWVGSIMLGLCLTIIIVVSFFGIDVWKISLPFAGGKLIFDLAWDHIQYSTGKSSRGSDIKGEEDGLDPVEREIKRAMSFPVRSSSSPSPTLFIPMTTEPQPQPQPQPERHEQIQIDWDEPTAVSCSKIKLFPRQRAYLDERYKRFSYHFPTLATAIPRLPFALIPFAFSQFILIEALSRQGWIEVFSHWLVKATDRKIHPTIWVVGVLGVLLCNLAGTNIGATILLTKIIRGAPEFPSNSTRAAAIALAVASNIGAVSFTFSASLAGLLWDTILKEKGIKVKQRSFAFWNLAPLLVMTGVGLAVVSAEMAVLYRPKHQ